MSTFVGKPEQKEQALIQEPKPEPKVERKPVEGPNQAEKTRAQLVEEAEELGIKVPKNANKAQIQKLIEDAPVM